MTSQHDNNNEGKVSVESNHASTATPGECKKITAEEVSTSSSTSIVLTPPHQLLSVDIVNSTIVRPSGPRPNYVAYSVHLHSKSSSAEDSYSDLHCIQRRYSDFLSLHKKLKKHHYNILNQMVFPKKLLSGNFCPENIGRRSHALEQYLGHLLDTVEIRRNPRFIEFFFKKELREGLRSMTKFEYSTATTSLYQAFHTITLLSPPDSYDMLILIKSSLVVCHAADDNQQLCYTSATEAIELIDAHKPESPLLLTLLVGAANTAIALGKRNDSLKSRAASMSSKSELPLESLPSLQEVLFKELDFYYRSL